jgi:7-cyano-7-deazaguanine reductase
MKKSLPAKLETFPNPSPARDYLVRIEIPEFTCLCPITGQPDFGRFVLEFIPDRRNVELKSLKLYVYSYRDQGAFHEAVSNRVLDDLVAAIAPRFLRVTALWNVRGGIYTSVVAEHRKKGWKPQPAVDLRAIAGAAARRDASLAPFVDPGAAGTA